MTDEIGKALASDSGASGKTEDEQGLKEKQAALKTDLDAIVQLFLTAGSHKEVNLPQTIVKKTIADIQENKNYHPDVLKPVLEKTYEMVRTSHFNILDEDVYIPQFL